VSFFAESNSLCQLDAWGVAIAGDGNRLVRFQVIEEKK
jgi:hypothetical protein